MRPGPSQPCVQGFHGDHKGKPGKNVKASVSPGDAEFSLFSWIFLFLMDFITFGTDEIHEKVL